MLLTVDIGTSNFKAALFNFKGGCLAFTSVPLLINGGYETESYIWLKSFEDCVNILSKESRGNLSKTEAVVICGNGPTLVPVLGGPSIESGALYAESANARLWLDRRSVKYQKEVSLACGGFVDAGFFLPKILYIKNEEPCLYEKVKHFLGCPEYLAFALTGEARTVVPSDGFERWFWDDAVLEKLKLDTSKFPPFIRPGSIFGTMMPSVARHFGFNKEIPVISGGPDFFAAILGAGITEPGQALDRSGSSEGINLCTLNRVTDERLMSYGHPVKPYWNLSGIINTTGKALQWGCDFLELNGNSLNRYELFLEIARESKPGSNGVFFHPYLAGERAPLWDSSVRGSWHGINLNTTRSDFANSILEGIGFAIRDVITVMEAGTTVNELRVTGGMAESLYLNQIKADITGKAVLVPSYKEAELLGCAIIGSNTLGFFSSLAESSSAVVSIGKCFYPNPENKKMYDEMFSKYLKSREGGFEL